MSRSERIAQQLGMSQGAAQNRLRKRILFSFAQRLKEDTCFKCGNVIESVDELSVEHKQPWENRSSDLFWDLNNIAFSHLICNTPHAYKGGGHNKKICPEGMNWCFRHKDFLSVQQFVRNPTRASGYHNLCRECEHYSRV